MLDWIAKVGGLSSIILGIAQFVGNMESAQMAAISQMFYPGSDEEDDGGIENKKISSQVHRPEDTQTRCCLTCKAKMLTFGFVPHCCKSKCGNSKDRVLASAYQQVKHEMYVDSLLKQLRTMEGILREKLELTDTDWKKARRLYGMLRVEDFLDDAASDKVNKVKEMPPNRSTVDETEKVGNDDYARTKVFRGTTDGLQNDSTI